MQIVDVLNTANFINNCGFYKGLLKSIKPKAHNLKAYRV